MTDLDFSHLEPLITAQASARGKVDVTFRCPATGAVVTATGKIRKQAGILADAEREARNGVWNTIRRNVSSILRSTLGSGTVGRIANKAVSAHLTPTTATREEVRLAIVDAFATVRDQFEWNDERGGWVGLRTPDVVELGEA